jgi:hypothetical protein
LLLIKPIYNEVGVERERDKKEREETAIKQLELNHKETKMKRGM